MRSCRGDAGAAGRRGESERESERARESGREREIGTRGCEPLEQALRVATEGMTIEILEGNITWQDLCYLKT